MLGMTFPIRLNDIMSSPVETRGPDCTAQAAAATCLDRDIGSLVVVEEGEAVGIVTSDDFARILRATPTRELFPCRILCRLTS